MDAGWNPIRGHGARLSVMEELLGQVEAVDADADFVRRARRLLHRDRELLGRLAAGSPNADQNAARPGDEPS